MVKCSVCFFCGNAARKGSLVRITDPGAWGHGGTSSCSCSHISCDELVAHQACYNSRLKERKGLIEAELEAAQASCVTRQRQAQLAQLPQPACGPSHQHPEAVMLEQGGSYLKRTGYWQQDEEEGGLVSLVVSCSRLIHLR